MDTIWINLAQTWLKNTHKFIIQVWEALFRLELDIFFQWYKDVMVTTQCKESVKDILDRLVKTIMAENEILTESKESSEACDDDDKALQQQIENLQHELKQQLSGLEDDFKTFQAYLTENDDNWKLWDQFIHVDAFFYISLFFNKRELRF